MKYVNNTGPITSANECSQPGKCERRVEDSDPELMEFQKNLRKVKNIQAAVEDQIKSPILAAVIAETPEAEAGIRRSLTARFQSQS